MAGTIYNLNGNDKTLIFDTRASLLQPFKALNWTDLRLSLMISITKQSDPNDPTGLFENLGAGEDNNQVYIGLKSSDSLLPSQTNFFGVSTRLLTALSEPVSVQDSGQFNFFANDKDGNAHLLISNGVTQQNNSSPAFSVVRMQDAVTSPFYAGYATLLMFQMKRSDPTLSKVDVAGVSMNSTFFDNGVPFATDTSRANIRAMTAAATFTQFFGPFTFSSLPDALYLFWPFSLSRLRLHGWVLESY